MYFTGLIEDVISFIFFYGFLLYNLIFMTDDLLNDFASSSEQVDYCKYDSNNKDYTCDGNSGNNSGAELIRPVSRI